MGKIKKILTVLLLVCAAVCVSAAVASCADKSSSKHPNYKNPASSVGSDGKINENAYQISVTSEGGLPLDGVKVAAKKNGATKVEGISINGLVQFEIELDEYDLEVSNLPEGYYLREGASFKTSSRTRKAEIKIPSTVISGTAPAGNSYALGNIMYDFSYAAVQNDGSTVFKTLAELLETKKAVFINFWYYDCGPCRSEFPAIEAAYRSYSDSVAFVALSYRDSVSKIADFKANFYQSTHKLSLTFDMGQDLPGLGSMFSVTSYPTTVAVDRYGMITYIDSGSMTLASQWRSLFERYVSDGYVQTGNTENPGDPSDVERKRPDAAMPEPSALIEALTGAGADGKITAAYAEDDEYSWPWTVENDAAQQKKFISASNKGLYNTYAIINVDVQLEEGDILSYEYSLNCKGNSLRVVLNRAESVRTYTDYSDGWKDEYAIYIATRSEKVSLYFCYLRETDEEFDKNGEPEQAAIRNIYITNIKDVTRATDVKYSAVAPDGNGGYAYPEIVLGEDGYYRIKGKNGGDDTLLLADILNATVWTERLESATFVPSGESSAVAASLYNLSFWNNKINVNLGVENGSNFRVIYDGKDYSDIIKDSFYIQQFSDSGLLPVTEELMQALQAFTKTYCTLNNMTYGENQWLELCCYYAHFGSEKGHNNEKDMCYAKQSTVEGLIRSNALTAVEDAVYTVDNYKQWSMYAGGVMYKFTATRDGVYEIRTLDDNKDADPYLYVMDINGKLIYEQDDDLSYDSLRRDYHHGFRAYMYLEKDTVIYVQCTSKFHGDPQKYDMKITYLGDKYESLIYCSTEYGLYTVDGTGMLKYLAVDVAYDDAAGYFRAIGADGAMWSAVYIDFVRPNFFDMGNHSLKWIIDNGMFNLGKEYGNYTAVMRDYYNRSVAGKTATDWDYGLIEADAQLVAIIGQLMLKYTEFDPASNGWLSMACHFAYYGYESYAEVQQH